MSFRDFRQVLIPSSSKTCGGIAQSRGQLFVRAVVAPSEYIQINSPKIAITRKQFRGRHRTVIFKVAEVNRRNSQLLSSLSLTDSQGLPQFFRRTADVSHLRLRLLMMVLGRVGSQVAGNFEHSQGS
jgi:hypothetical protein